jgi:hypothetical protein
MAVQQIGGEYVGVSDNPDIPVRTVTETDRKGYKIDFDKISELICNVLSLNAEGTKIANEIISLGSLSLSQINIQVFLAISEPSTNSILAINNNSNGRRNILIIPEACSYSGSIPCVRAKITDLYFNSLLSDIVTALGIEKEIPPSLWRKEDLIIDCGQNKVWYKGCEIIKLDPLSHPYKFALHVAKANRGVVKKDDLNKLLSPSSHEDRIASKAKSLFLTKIKQSFKAAGREVNDDISKIFRNVAGVGYTIDCSSKVIS